MPQFTTSAKPILSHCETELIRKLALAVGDRCERLTQSERYQLLSVMSAWCHAYCELEEDENPQTLTEVYESYTDWEFTGNVKVCLYILRDEDVDNIAAISVAIAEYARNEYYEEPEPEEGEQMHEGELILTKLLEMFN